MTEERKAQLMRTVLPVIGLTFIFGVVALMRVWPAGWLWTPNQPEYQQMILGVYATLGIFLVLAGRAPREHRSLILFTAWSSLVHSGIMAVQALVDPTERGHLVGDVPALALIGVALLVLAPGQAEAATPRQDSSGRASIGSTVA